MRIKMLFLMILLFSLGCVTTKDSSGSSNYDVSVSVKDKGQIYGGGGFCGVSTYGECVSDSECKAGGCSSQICQSTEEEEVFTTCEYRECYNASKYNLKCKCFSNRCQWTQ